MEVPFVIDMISLERVHGRQTAPTAVGSRDFVKYGERVVVMKQAVLTCSTTNISIQYVIQAVWGKVHSLDCQIVRQPRCKTRQTRPRTNGSMDTDEHSGGWTQLWHIGSIESLWTTIPKLHLQGYSHTEGFKTYRDRLGEHGLGTMTELRLGKVVK
jgi:hypothetical protein